MDELNHRKVLRVGCKYCPKVRIWQSTLRRSSMVSTTSSNDSPKPSMTPDLVLMPAWRRRRSTSRLRSYFNLNPNLFGQPYLRFEVVETISGAT